MKRILILLAGLAALALPATAAAGSGHSTTVKLANTSSGKILVDSSGFTVYMFTKDSRNKDTCMKNSGCIATWPAVTVKGRPTWGAGVKRSLLGTIPFGHARRQVTYAGHPLYTYSQDAGPAATDYIGAQEFGGSWYGVSATGKAVK